MVFYRVNPLLKLIKSLLTILNMREQPHELAPSQGWFKQFLDIAWLGFNLITEFGDGIVERHDTFFMIIMKMSIKLFGETVRA